MAVVKGLSRMSRAGLQCADELLEAQSSVSLRSQSNFLLNYCRFAECSCRAGRLTN